jgi:hypothetical protein
VKRLIILLHVGLFVAGCAAIEQRDTQARNNELIASAKAATTACNEKISEGDPNKAMARAQCQRDAASIARPTERYPDLGDAFWATRMRIAEQVQAGKLTIAEGNELITNKSVELNNEGQRRATADRAVRAQEDANRAAILSTYTANNRPYTPPPAQPMIPQNHSINCNSVVNGNMISTNCN